MTSTDLPKGGNILVHFLGTLTMQAGRNVGISSVYARGEEAVLTQSVIEANRDRYGRCAILELLDDEPAQVQAWGEVKVRRGPWPPGQSKLSPGSASWAEAREAARQAAHLIEDEAHREAALVKVSKDFGAFATSRTMATYGSGQRAHLAPKPQV